VIHHQGTEYKYTRSNQTRLAIRTNVQVYLEVPHSFGGVYSATSSVRTMQHGALFGPKRSSVIVRPLLGRTRAALGQIVDRWSPLVVAAVTCSPASLTTTLGASLVFRVLSKSITPTPGILALPCSARIASNSALLAAACGCCWRLLAFRRSHARGQGMVQKALGDRPARYLPPHPRMSRTRVRATAAALRLHAAAWPRQTSLSCFQHKAHHLQQLCRPTPPQNSKAAPATTYIDRIRTPPPTISSPARTRHCPSATRKITSERCRGRSAACGRATGTRRAHRRRRKAPV